MEGHLVSLIYMAEKKPRLLLHPCTKHVVNTPLLKTQQQQGSFFSSFPWNAAYFIGLKQAPEQSPQHGNNKGGRGGGGRDGGGRGRGGRGGGSSGGMSETIKDYGVALAGEIVDFMATFDGWTEKPEGNLLAISVVKRYVKITSNLLVSLLTLLICYTNRDELALATIYLNKKE